MWNISSSNKVCETRKITQVLNLIYNILNLKYMMEINYLYNIVVQK